MISNTTLIVVATAALPLAGLQPAAPQPESSAQGENADRSELMRRLTEVDLRIAKIKDLRADFKQLKHTALLKKPLESSGRVFVKGDRIRWDTVEPRRSSMAVSDGEIRIYFPDDGVVEVYRAEGDLRELSASPLPRLEWLTSKFELKPIDARLMGETEPSSELIAVELAPKSADLREHVEVIRVLIDARLPCMRRMELTDADAERTVIDLREIHIDSGVPEHEVDLEVPEGTRITRPLEPRPRTPPDGTSREEPKK